MKKYKVYRCVKCGNEFLANVRECYSGCKGKVIPTNMTVCR